MNYKICDIHAHVVPQIDDGANSIAMAWRCFAQPIIKVRAILYVLRIAGEILETTPGVWRHFNHRRKKRISV